jgi:hypothetical protein
MKTISIITPLLQRGSERRGTLQARILAGSTDLEKMTTPPTGAGLQRGFAPGSRFRSLRARALRLIEFVHGVVVTSKRKPLLRLWLDIPDTYVVD